MRKSLSAALAGAAAVLLLTTSACSTGSAAVEKVDAPAAVDLIEAGEHTVIDVRTPEEFAAAHVEGAENIDVSSPDFEEIVAELDKDEEYVVYCQSGNRSAQAVDKMADLGFTELVDAGGIVDLQGAGAELASGS